MGLVLKPDRLAHRLALYEQVDERFCVSSRRERLDLFPVGFTGTPDLGDHSQLPGAKGIPDKPGCYIEIGIQLKAVL